MFINMTLVYILGGMIALYGLALVSFLVPLAWTVDRLNRCVRNLKPLPRRVSSLEAASDRAADRVSKATVCLNEAVATILAVTNDVDLSGAYPTNVERLRRAATSVLTAANELGHSSKGAENLHA